VVDLREVNEYKPEVFWKLPFLDELSVAMSGYDFEYVFPSIRGVQAGREYFVTMCPLKLIPRIFLFDEEELRPELRAQRGLNKQRVPEMCRYLLENREDYTFSALTASIDGDVKFEPVGEEDSERHMGRLRVPMEARFVINDGQHRRAAIEAALHEDPDLGYETIAVVFFLDHGLERCQQMFADLNRFPIRPTRSLGILYDHRDELAVLSKELVDRIDVFRDLCETEKTSISNRSTKLITLSAVYTATRILLRELEFDSIDERVDAAVGFWSKVVDHMPDWQQARDRVVRSAELRRDFIHPYGLALSSIARVGNVLLRDHPRSWEKTLSKLESLDWSRGNTDQWEGRALVAGRVSKRNINIVLTANLIKEHLGLSLTDEEQEAERQLKESRNGVPSRRTE